MISAAGDSRVSSTFFLYAMPSIRIVLPLIALNAADFSRFADLELEDWSKRRARR